MAAIHLKDRAERILSNDDRKNGAPSRTYNYCTDSVASTLVELHKYVVERIMLEWLNKRLIILNPFEICSEIAV